MMKAITGRKGLLLGASLAAVVGAPVAAIAQTAPREVQTVNVLDEITVSAQRRDQNRQDVPVTVTVLGGQLVEQARIQSVQDVVARTPGLQFDAYPASEPRLSVRGVSSSDRGAAGDPSSAVFVDEIYYGRPAAINFDSFDLQRIEVLKGPQGTLFGRNVVGGAVNIVTNRPDLDNFDAAVEGSLGNYASRDLSAFVNLPLADGKLGLRLGAGLHTHDGYVDRIVDGVKEGEVDDRDSKSGRAQLRFEPSDAFAVNMTADFAKDRAKGPANRALFDSGDGGLSGLYDLNTDRDFNNAAFDGRQDRDTWGVRTKVEWDLPFASLNYLGSYRDLDYDAAYDFDGAITPFGVGGIDGAVTERSQLSSHELQLKSLPSSPLNWVVGLYRYRGETFRSSASYLDLGDILDDVIDQDSVTTSSAIYGDVTWPVTDKLNVFGGARYTKDRKTMVASGQSNAEGTFFTNENYADVATSESWGATTWRLGADYHIAPELMVYGSVSRGFKSGGYQETPADGAEAAATYDPEFITNYELGLRSQFFDNRVTWNSSIYWADYTDLQVRVPTGMGIRTSNAGKARIKGLETELTWKVGAGFALNASYAYTHARFVDNQTIEDGEAVDYSGNRLTRIPDHKITLSPSYTLDLDSGASVKVAADYVHESTIYDDQSNQPPEIREPTDFIDGRVIYTDAADHWSFSVWGKNLTNEKTRTFTGTLGGVTFGAYNPPTTYGVTLRYNY